MRSQDNIRHQDPAAGRSMAGERGSFGVGLARVPDLNGDGVDDLAVTHGGEQQLLIIDPTDGRLLKEVPIGRRYRDFVALYPSRGGRAGLLVGGLGYRGWDPFEVRLLPRCELAEPVSVDGRYLYLPQHAGLEDFALHYDFRPALRPVGARRRVWSYSFQLLRSGALVSQFRLPCVISAAPCLLGDLDGDSHPDLLLACEVPRFDDDEFDFTAVAVSGRRGATIYRSQLSLPVRCERGTAMALAVSGRDGSPLRIFEAPRANALREWVDADGDGARDFAFVYYWADGEDNALWVYSARTGRLLYEVLSPRALDAGLLPDSFGCTTCPLGDVDGDGIRDVGVGAKLPHSSGGDWVVIVSGNSGRILRQFNGRDHDE